jgi:ribosomal protein L11 methyltransferase
MEWVELTLPAGALAEEIAAILVEVEPVFADGAEVRGEDIVLYSPADAAPAVADAMRAAAVKLAAQGFELDPATLRVRPAPPEEEWRDAWKRYFHIKRFGKRIVIVPSWERESYVAQDGDVVLDLDPGRAFGTGAHASTRLCLVELEELADTHGVRARRVLDVGTGSGILSVAAAKLWPECTGVAVDVDPIAVGAARENLDQNGVGARFETSDRRAGEIAETFDVVLANIQADVLLSLRDAIVARVAPGGALILSGLLHDQAPFVAEKYVAAGLTLVRTHQLDDDRDWMSVLLRRP